MDTYLQWITPSGQCCGYDNVTGNECYQLGLWACVVFGEGGGGGYSGHVLKLRVWLLFAPFSLYVHI